MYQSKYYWSQLLSNLAVIPLLVLIGLLLVSQMRTLQQSPDNHPPGWQQPDYLEYIG